MSETISLKLMDVLHRRKVTIVYTNSAQAAVFLEKLSEEEKEGLIRDFGFDFSNPLDETAGITSYRYNHCVAEQYAATHEV